MRATVEYEQSVYAPKPRLQDIIIGDKDTTQRQITSNNPTIIEVPVVIEGREIARATAPYQEEFDRWREGR